MNYVCPVPAARDVPASAKGRETAAPAEDPLIFPDSAMRERPALARDITSQERAEFGKRWNVIARLRGDRPLER